MKTCKKILLHICMICSSIDIMTMVLDYFNPYMNFSGAVRWLHLMLFGCLLMVLLLPQPRKTKTDYRQYVPDKPQARQSHTDRQRPLQPTFHQVHV